jgi:hypothetical protein
MMRLVSKICLRLIALMMGLSCFQASAANEYCSAAGFHDYYSSVIKAPNTIARISSGPYTLRKFLGVDSAGAPQFSVVRKTDVADLKNLEATTIDKFNLKTSVSDYDDVVVTDEAGKILLVYKFLNENCWRLSSVEDWRIETGVQATGEDTGLKMSGIIRGDLYSDLAAHEDSNSRVYLFEAALDSYVEGANDGSDESAYKAVALTLSGEAPRLDDNEIFRLLTQSSNSVQEGALALAAFYCDEGREERPANCLNPKSAIEALVKAGRIGSPEAFYELARHYETGDWLDKNIGSALSCYKAAVKAGSSDDQDVRRLESEGVKENKNEKFCSV